MTVLVNNQPFNIVVGQSEVGPLDLPNGTMQLLVTYNCSTWPTVSDGTLTVTLRVANDGVNFVDVWTDTFEHVQLRRGGIVQSTASFGIGLQAPFAPTARLRVRFNSTVAISTSVTVQAT